MLRNLNAKPVAEILAAKQAVKEVKVSSALIDYLIGLVRVSLNHTTSTQTKVSKILTE